MSAMSVSADRGRRKARDRLREQAGLAFVASAGSVADLRNDPRFAAVPLRSLQRWALTDAWHERRRSVLQKAAEQTEEAIAGQLAASFAAEVHDLLELRAQAIEKLRDEALRARSWEGTAKVLVEIHRRLGELRAEREPEPTPALEQTGPRPTFTAEEAAAAAHAILRVRRERMRADLAPSTRAEPLQ